MQDPTQLLQRDGVVMMVLVEMMVWMMMIPMNSSLMMVLMAMISPLREGISSAEICLPESSFSLCSFPPRRGGGIFLWPLSPNLGFRGEDIGKRAELEVGQGGHTPCRCGPGWPAPRGWGGPVAKLRLPFWHPSSSGKIFFSVIILVFF